MKGESDRKGPRSVFSSGRSRAPCPAQPQRRAEPMSPFRGGAHPDRAVPGHRGTMAATKRVLYVGEWPGFWGMPAGPGPPAVPGDR